MHRGGAISSVSGSLEARRWADLPAIVGSATGVRPRFSLRPSTYLIISDMESGQLRSPSKSRSIEVVSQPNNPIELEPIASSIASFQRGSLSTAQQANRLH